MFKKILSFLLDLNLLNLSIDGLYKAMGYQKRNSTYPQFTDHCFTGEYPIKPVDASDKDFMSNKMSFMSSKI